MLRMLSLGAAVALVIVPGLIHGTWTGRWRSSRELKQAVARLDRVPQVIGEWKGKALELDRREVEHADLAGYVTRRYENRRTGSVVVLALMCGRPGPVSVHTPDVCYRGAGYELAASPIRFTAVLETGGSPAEFWTARFQRPGLVARDQRRIFWAWSATGDWQAPENPRLTFARFPALYKLYLIRETGARDEHLEDDPCKEFMQQLLPELRKAIFPER
jgi:hypothetical protein